MLAAALPQPTTMVRPFGGFGRYAGSDFSGSAAAIAASNICRSNFAGSIVTRKPNLSQHEGHEGNTMYHEGEANQKRKWTGVKSTPMTCIPDRFLNFDGIALGSAFLRVTSFFLRVPSCSRLSKLLRDCVIG